MLLREILEEADLLVGNAISEDRKIRFVNEVQRKVYRDFPPDLLTYSFTTINGRVDYLLPPSCTDESVESVFVDNKEYEHRTTQDPSSAGLGYVIVDGLIILTEPPSGVLEGYVTFRARPDDYTINELDKEPQLYSDYHELLVFGLAEKLAMINGDFKTADQFAARFQQLLNEANLKIKRIKMKKIRIVRGWA